MSHSVWATFSYWFVLESFHEHRTRYRASLVNPIHFHTHAFSNFSSLPHPCIFPHIHSSSNQHHLSDCDVILYDSYNQCLVIHHVTFMFNLFSPPPQKLQKIYKKFKVSKKIFKKTKKSFKKLFSIFPKWHYFNFAISILVFVAIKMHLLKWYLRRYLYFIFIQKLFQWCIPCRQRVFIGYRLFKLMIDQSELTFNDFILHLKSQKPPFFSNFTIFAKFRMKKLIKQKYSFWTCGIHLQMSFGSVEISQSLFFVSCFRVKWVTWFDHG